MTNEDFMNLVENVTNKNTDLAKATIEANQAALDWMYVMLKDIDEATYVPFHEDQLDEMEEMDDTDDTYDFGIEVTNPFLAEEEVEEDSYCKWCKIVDKEKEEQVSKSITEYRRRKMNVA